jgi:selenocysteine lyase/cysteine desulfurase
VDLVELDEVVWARLPEREEAGSPNVIGAVALGAALEELTALGWQRIRVHDDTLARAMRDRLAAIPGVRVLGAVTDGLPIATFVVDGVPHALVAARLSAEFGIGVRHGCFCAHPYLTRLLGLHGEALECFHAAARRHDRSRLPGAVRASAGIATSRDDVRRLCAAVEVVASTPPPVPYDADAAGDRWPRNLVRPRFSRSAPVGQPR